ncbi:MAG: hypothetical protein IJZ54_07015 [Clostridia bacterium]|nr:hypothetical protein [Clostridia bacterium]
MAREVTGAREMLCSLNEHFPEKELLTKKDIYGFLGVSRNTLRKYFPELWKMPYTNKSDLAKILARQSVA